MEFDHVDDTVGDPPGEWPQHFQGYAKIQAVATPFRDGPTVFAVHFDPGGRSRPHSHRAGQLLYITSGEGIVGGVEGRTRVRAGDVVATMPGEWHWHGAAPESAMTHLTVQLAGPDSIDWNVDERDWASGYDPEPGGTSGGT